MEEQLPLITEDRPARTPRLERRRAAARRSRGGSAWHLDAETRRIGLEGVANAKATLRAAREARQASEAA
jgi:hypothetical protein